MQPMLPKRAERKALPVVLDTMLLPGMIGNEKVWSGFPVYSNFKKFYRSYDDVKVPLRGSGAPKQCFRNAIDYVVANNFKPVYTEGWIVFKDGTGIPGFPIEHAWNGDIEVTLGDRVSDFDYFGLAFDGEFAAAVAQSDLYAGSLFATLARTKDQQTFIARFGDPFMLEAHV